MKKKIIITLSRVFPVTHSRRGEPTGFANKLASGEKKHTIRSNYDLWNVNAEKMERGKFYLSIRQWSGRPYNSPQVEIAQRHNPIGVQPVELYYHADNDTITAKIDGREGSMQIATPLPRMTDFLCRISKNGFSAKTQRRIKFSREV
jgi:hypothetical protein